MKSEMERMAREKDGSTGGLTGPMGKQNEPKKAVSGVAGGRGARSKR
jgi:hypothetical protein